MTEPEPDPRPFGCVQFADPSTAHMASRITTFNEPYSKDSVGESKGIQPRFGHQSPWSQRHDGDEAFANMRRLRGVEEKHGKA